MNLSFSKKKKNKIKIERLCPYTLTRKARCVFKKITPLTFDDHFPPQVRKLLELLEILIRPSKNYTILKGKKTKIYTQKKSNPFLISLFQTISLGEKKKSIANLLVEIIKLN